MTAKEYLFKIQKLEISIRQKMYELDSLRAKSIATGSLDYSKDKVQTSPSPDAPYAKTIQKLVDFDAEIDRMIDRKNYMVGRMDKICSGLLTPDEYEIIRLRYYNSWKWTDVMEASGYKDRTIFRIHGRALEKLDAQDIVV